MSDHSAPQSAQTNRNPADELFWAIELNDLAVISNLMEETFDENKSVLLKFVSVRCSFSSNSNYDNDHTRICEHIEGLKFLKDHSQFTERYNFQIHKQYNTKITIVHYAVRSNCPNLLQFLREEGCDLDANNEFGETPLSWAASIGALNAIRFLMQSGNCNLKSQDVDGCTLLMKACFSLKHEVVEMFLHSELSETERVDTLRCVLRPERCEQHGTTCSHILLLDFLTEQFGSEAFRKCLESPNKFGCTAVQTAVRSNCKSLLEHLKDHGCSLNTPDNDGDTALCEAALCGKCSSIQFLLDNDSNIEHQNESGETPFLLACSRLQTQAADLLRQAGANVNAIDKCRNTALHLASMNSLTKPDMRARFLHILLSLLDFSDQSSEDRNNSKSIQQLQLTNLSNHNVLHVLTDNGNLITFLKLTEIEALKGQLFPLFRNPDGLSILHVHVAKYSLEDLHKFIKDSKILSADQWKGIICERVQTGHFRGYSCLHFACQMGHQQNIEYLLKEYSDDMTLHELAATNCLSPMDVLIKHRHDLLLHEIESVSFQQVIESTDDVLAALNLPSPDQAKQALIPLCEPDLQGVVMNPKQHRNKRYTSGSSINAGKGEMVYPAAVRLFYIALKDDSVEIFDQILALGFWSYLKTVKAAKNLNKFLCHLIANKSGDVNEVLPIIHKEVSEYIKLHRNDGKSICFDLPAATLMGVALKSGRINIVKRLLQLDQYHLIPTCLLVIEECQMLASNCRYRVPECIQELCAFSLNLVLNAMSAMDNQIGNLMNEDSLYLYLDGVIGQNNTKPNTFIADPVYKGFRSEFSHGLSIFQLGAKYTANEIVSSNLFKTFSKTAWSERQSGQSFCATPRQAFILHSICYALFIVLLTYYVPTVESGQDWKDFALYLFVISFALQEGIDLWTADAICSAVEINSSAIDKVWTKIKLYFSDGWNVFDVSGILLLIIALAWKNNLDGTGGAEVHDTSKTFFVIRMILSTSHLLWGLRIMSFLRLGEHFGPSISMMRNLFRRDLLPFLVIFFTISFSFGVFFFNLLNPGIRSYSSTGEVGARDLSQLLTIYTRPLFTAFGQMDISDVADCENLTIQSDWQRFNESSVMSGKKCTHPVGSFHYRNWLIFPFLFVINLTMLNMLIAKFSLTVSSQEDVAYMIWRRYDTDLLLEYRRIPTLPPPFTILWIAFVVIYNLWKFCGERRCNSVAPNSQLPDPKVWWDQANLEKALSKRFSTVLKGSDDCPSGFAEFLHFQARSFRGQRRSFTTPRKDHGSTMEKLKVDIQNLSSKIPAK